MLAQLSPSPDGRARLLLTGTKGCRRCRDGALSAASLWVFGPAAPGGVILCAAESRLSCVVARRACTDIHVQAAPDEPRRRAMQILKPCWRIHINAGRKSPLQSKVELVLMFAKFRLSDIECSLLLLKHSF